MNRTLSVVTLCAVLPAMGALEACEGEPPANSPENQAAAGSAAGAIVTGPDDAAPSAATPRPGASPGTMPTIPPMAGMGAIPMTSAMPAMIAMPTTGDAAAPCPMATAAPPCAHGAGAADASAAASTAVTPGAAATVGNLTGRVTTKPSALAANAVVYLEDGPRDESRPPPTVHIDNRQMTFAPFVQVVPAGGKVVFSNSDPFPHNVFSPDNDKFNMGNIPQNVARQRVFEHPGAYTLLCNLHPGMLGYLVVTPSGYFARTDAKGKYALKAVPAGTYKVTAWAPRQVPVTQSATVGEGDATADFELHR